jgi:putative nucleotidyltransferase with HDIG domain
MTLRAGRDLVGEARALAEDLLAPVGSRWHHTQGVAARAASAAAAVTAPDRPVLVAATYLHDIGYAEPLQRSGFHPLDGALFLQEQGWPALVVGLVAHHSGARFVAEVRGLSAELKPFDDERFVCGPLADAVTFADQTSGPDGGVVDVETRMADMLRRHGPHSPNARCHGLRAPVLRAAVAATERRLGTAS